MGRKNNRLQPGQAMCHIRREAAIFSGCSEIPYWVTLAELMIQTGFRPVKPQSRPGVFWPNAVFTRRLSLRVTPSAAKRKIPAAGQVSTEFPVMVMFRLPLKVPE